MYLKKTITAKYASLFTICAILACAAAVLALIFFEPIGLGHIMFLALAAISVAIAGYAASDLKTKIANPLAQIAAALDERIKGKPNENFEIRGADGEFEFIAELMRKEAARMLEHIDLFDRVRDGDFSIEFYDKNDGDLMNQMLHGMIEHQRGLVQCIKAVSSQISSASREIAGGSQTLASGSNEQSMAIEQFRATVESIRIKAEDNLSKAQETAHAIASYMSIVDDVSCDLHAMAKTMEEISDSARRISKVSDVIEGIAFQTNILALNAAVEAARAGQHGKGFAVVADEVRELSSKSAEAARETAKIIREDWETIDAGNRIMESAVVGMDNISKIAAENRSRMETLSESSISQRDAIAEISEGISQISQIVQSNASLSQESAAASEELSTQAYELDKLIALYKIDGRQNI